MIDTQKKRIRRLTGKMPDKFLNRYEIKTTIIHKAETDRLAKLIQHPSIQLDKNSICSMSLILRRSLNLLYEYQQTSLCSDEATEIERTKYLRLAKTGNTIRGG
ncbi:hypothetical protein [Polynucleobacter antarcticus]|uniref:Uncharacterized protein n=1 Tax=Polynucleobacter antarcticus TaxID=1743162 RepID=A0A6M9PI78_9BURK|nr:hypothetical protein [Polynucleobacter antarcticus]QKM62580.1 hypothetical protein DCO16_05560 [Polynucleobacter antarcticus]